MQPETKFKMKVMNRLKTILDLYVVKIQQVSVRGIPDLIICYKGKFVAWELKVPPNKLKAGSLQEHNLNLISKAGGIAREVTPQNFEQSLKELLEC